MMKTFLKIALAVAVILVLTISGYLVVSRPASLPLPSRASDTFRLTVANINFENVQRDALSRTLVDTNSDLIVVFEWTGKNLNLELLTNQGFTILLNDPRRGTHGTCVIARHPRTGDANLIPAPIQGPCQIPFAAIRVQRRGEFVTIVGVHAPPPVLACQQTTAPTLQAVASWVRQGKLLTPLGKSKKGEPVIVAGDLNVSPFHSVLRELSHAELHDAYSSATWCPGPTWTPRLGFPACVRVDYIWIPDEFTPHNAHVIPLPGSDHRGVVVDMDWKEA